eukprot:8911_1
MSDDDVDESWELKNWLKKNNLFEQVVFEVLWDNGIEDPECDFAYIKEKQWKAIKRECTVRNTSQVNHDTKARQRFEKKLGKIEKVWRQQSGIKPSSIQYNEDGSVKTRDESKRKKKPAKYIYGVGVKTQRIKDVNESKKNNSSKKKSKPKTLPLKEWLRQEDMYDNETYSVLIECGIKNAPKDLKKISSEKKWDAIYRRLTVERFKQTNHDQKSRMRLQKKLNKLEKIWRKESGIIKTSITDDKPKSKSKKKKGNSKKKKIKTKTK